MQQDSNSRNGGRDLLEYLQPFSAYFRLKIVKTGQIAPGRARLLTKPPAIGSDTAVKTMGIVWVFDWNCATSGFAWVTMTSGADPDVTSIATDL